MSRNYNEMIDDCTGSAVTDEILSLGNGVHIIAHRKAKKDKAQRMKVRQLETDTVNLELPEEIKKCNRWFPVISNGSFNIIKDPNGTITSKLNGEIPQVSKEQLKDVIFLTRNQVINNGIGIDKYGGKTTTEAPYSDIVDSLNKNRIIRICREANALGL